MLTRIANDVSRLIKSQQYVHDTYIITKELVENSLDAGASRISIVISEGSIIVEDNGCGMVDLTLVGTPGCTSKEAASYRAINAPNTPGEGVSFTHGFRGQALAAIAEMCDVQITSRVSSESLASHRDYATGRSEKRAREVGTTVTVRNIFKRCPIREKHDRRSIRKSLGRIISLVRGYSYVYSTYFQVVFKGKTLASECGSENTKDIAIQRHGREYVEIRDEKFQFWLFPFAKSGEQVVLIEKRVCSYERIATVIGRVFEQYFSYPATYVLVISDECDFNLSVDKTEVILKSSKRIEGKIKAELDRYFALRHYIRESKEVVIELKDDVKEEVKDTKDKNGENGACCAHGDIETRDIMCQRPQERLIVTPASRLIVTPASQPQETSASDTKRVKNGDEIDSTIKSTPARLDCQTSSPQDHLETPLYSQASSQPQRTRHGQRGKSVYNFIREESMAHSKLIFEKTDFSTMKVIGQFNQGFILCVLQKNGSTFLIAVDQHAADEIYNFERLKNGFKLKKQQLVSPHPLNLTPIQQLLVDEHVAALETNGFTVTNGMLTTIPVYQGVFFSVQDFYSLLELIAQGEYVSEKFRRVMASKACRSSVMIGTGLSLREMKGLLDNLGTLELPWNCPHGRPTFKVLCEMRSKAARPK